MYKTISLKLLNPTAAKRKILDDTIERYSEAFEITLRNIKSKINEPYYNNKKFNRTKFLKLIEKSDFAGTEHLGIEPFKDAVKLDLAKVISVYFARRESRNGNVYPVTRTDEKDLYEVTGEISSDRKEFDRVFRKFGTERAVLFCRHDEKRDYSIICDSGRYFAKLYVFNRKNAVNSKRYIICPIIVPEVYKKYFGEEYYPQHFKSAELIKKGRNFFLNIRIWIETQKTSEFSTYVGVIRGSENEIFYNLSDREGRKISSAGISFKKVKGMNKIHLLANSIVKIAKENNSKIIFGNISTVKKSVLSNEEYSRLIFCISYKAELQGLSDTVSVSTKGIFTSCPECNNDIKENLNDDDFVCTSCGYHNSTEEAAAENVAKALIKYRCNKINVTVRRMETMCYFEIAPLKYYFQCEADEKALDKFHDDLYHYLMNNIKNFDSNQKAIAYKISDGGVDSLKMNFS